MNLNNFMNNGIQNITDTATRFYLNNHKGQSFMLRLGLSLRKSAKKRDQYEELGIHVPPFLIASISSACNLRCTGCYARVNVDCDNETSQREMCREDWQRIFHEASDLGISFILIAGGEPLLRRDVIELASGFPNIIFPIFTNGTLLDDNYLSLFDTYRNLIPVLSIEGDDAMTDARRGNGISKKVARTGELLKERNILTGISITVTSKNYAEVTELSFLQALREKGCGLVFFVEYVPAEKGTEDLVLGTDDLPVLKTRINNLRSAKTNKGMIILSFPGDEEAMGGCLAAGRGFFHINQNGGAEPCPFSPFSTMNLKKQSMTEVLTSNFFTEVREISAAETLNHKGGCTLFSVEGKVKDSLNNQGI